MTAAARVDVHSHLLPGLDDGAADWDEALTLARTAVADGTAQLILTPHVYPEVYDNRPETIRGLTAEFQRRLDAAGVPLRVRPGSEVFLVPETARAWRRGELVPLGGEGPYVLVEWNMIALPPYVEGVLFELQAAGAVPVVAHPERYLPVQRRPEWLVPLVERGVWLQITASALLRPRRDPVRRTAEWLVRRGMVHLIGSDAHNAHRPPQLAEAYRELGRLPGGMETLAVVERATAAVLAGERIDLPRPAVRRRRRFWL
ncbi:protein-tyrosine-phosphatase [Thermaerobacter sp. FW80]|uniref:tyrosine-protein phosphatase n=1 Tax=Thermaerobacter sp. FW80 TaxID=2546351 RepID=UPI000DB79F01|nr:CpsB/CapC family capsule biosynthesis tyrosine phosphatase [Thermaerobacter sp. FW80]PZN06619.1 MAG: protein-tyrosine-phosphatase [Bacillota bacterium]QBS37633.1 protein-tyrosine-phosphatase [Thermaerobacter sp. FW80]